MFPLNNWNNLKRSYRLGEKTFYNSWHTGLDIICSYGTELLAPFDGEAKAHYSLDGGWVIEFRPHHLNILIRFMHLSKIIKRGNIRIGETIAKTGNTGRLSRGFHAHIDLSFDSLQLKNKSNFIDPENWVCWETNMLIRNSSGEISYLSSKKTRHPLNEKAYNELFDAGYFFQVTDEFYANLPVGQAIIL